MAMMVLKDVVSGAYLADGRIDYVLKVNTGGQDVQMPFTLDPKEKDPDILGPWAPGIVAIAKRKKLKIAPYVVPAPVVPE